MQRESLVHREMWDPEESIRPRVPKQLRWFLRAFRDRPPSSRRTRWWRWRARKGTRRVWVPLRFHSPLPFSPSVSIGEDLIHINGDRIDFTARSLLAVFRDIDVPAHKLFGPPRNGYYAINVMKLGGGEYHRFRGPRVGRRRRIPSRKNSSHWNTGERESSMMDLRARFLASNAAIDGAFYRRRPTNVIIQPTIKSW